MKKNFKKFLKTDNKRGIKIVLLPTIIAMALIGESLFAELIEKISQIEIERDYTYVNGDRRFIRELSGRSYLLEENNSCLFDEKTLTK